MLRLGGGWGVGVGWLGSSAQLAKGLENERVLCDVRGGQGGLSSWGPEQRDSP